MGTSVQRQTDVRKAMFMEVPAWQVILGERALTASKHLDFSETTFTTAHLERYRDATGHTGGDRALSCVYDAW